MYKTRALTDRYLEYKPDLQGLRAVAIIWVVLAHTGFPVFQGGFIGVDVFFVLSGYLITGLLVAELQQSGRIEFLCFYARRLKRLLPALVFMLSIVSILAFFLLSHNEALVQLQSSLFATTWVSNLYFAFTEFDYFDELAERDLFLHTWSLGVEEQFYLLWPTLILILFKVSPLKQSKLTLMFFGLSIVLLISFILSLYWSVTMPQMAFYLMPARVWQFTLGAIIHTNFFRIDIDDKDSLLPAVNKKPNGILLLTGLTLIIGGGIIIAPGYSYPGYWALVPSFGAAFVIAAIHFLPRNEFSLLAHPALVWIGDRSYSLYLWHWPIFTLGFSLGLYGQVLPIVGLVLLSLLMAIISYRIIEFPFWKGSLSFFQPSRILLVGLLVIVTMLFIQFHGLRQIPVQVSSNSSDQSNQWRMDLPIIYRMPCDAWYLNADVKPCVFGNNTAEKTVVLLGDSIGAQWFSILPEIFSVPQWRLIVFTKSSCAMVDEDYVYGRIGRIYQVCSDWRTAVLDELDILKPDVLILGSSATYGFSESQWEEGSSRVFQRVSKAVKTVFVIPGTPSLGFDGPGCVARNITNDGFVDRQACSAKGRVKLIESATKYLSQSASHISNVYMLDLNGLVCPNGKCNAISKNGVIVFRDSQHLTDSFVRAQSPLVAKKLERVLNLN